MSRMPVFPPALVFFAGLLPSLAFAEMPLELRKDILTHEQARNLEDGALSAYLGHDDPQVRTRAALALGRIQDPSTIEALAGAAVDEDASVRREAVFALGQMFDPAALPALHAALANESDPGNRRTAVLALGKCGDDGTVETLTGLLADADLGPAAAQALGTLAVRGVDIASAGPALDQALRARAPELTWRAAFAVQRGRVGATNVGLQRALEAEDPLARIFACRAIGALGQERLGQSVLPKLKDEDWRVRVEAARALAATDNRAFASQVSLLLDDPENLVVFAAVEVLGRMGPEGLGRLREVEKSSEWLMRTAWLRARAEVSRDGALDDLKIASRDPDWRIRKTAAECFALAPSGSGLLLLEAMVADESPLVQTAAVNSLVQFPQIAALEPLRKALAAEDPGVLTAAANGAAERLDRSAVPLLTAAYGPLVAPVDAEVMVAILEALGTCLNARDEDGGIGEYTDAQWEDAVALLERESAHTHPRIARAAAVSLARTRGEDPASVPGLRPMLPETVDIDRLAALETHPGEATARIITSRGEIAVRLLPREAPGTVDNFAQLAEGGYYNGLTFHRVIADFVAQGGDPRGDGWGGPGYEIRCEYNDVPYGTGTVGMALSGKDTGGSQFFITHSPQPHLDGRYTVFGQVIEGMDVVNSILLGDKIQEIRIEGL